MEKQLYLCDCLVCIPDRNRYRITSIKCHINTVISADDEQIVARNMYRKGINMLRKIVHQVDFLYKIIQGCTGNKNIKQRRAV